MSDRRSPLPLPTRRGLNREQAADYVGIGVTLFDEMVEDGRMPQPKEIGARVNWDRDQLDEFYSRLPNRRTTASAGAEIKETANPWDKRFGAG